MALNKWDTWECLLCLAANHGLTDHCSKCGTKSAPKPKPVPTKQMPMTDFPYYCWACSHRCMSSACLLCGGYASFAPDTSADPPSTPNENQHYMVPAAAPPEKMSWIKGATLNEKGQIEISMQIKPETKVKPATPKMPPANRWRPRNYRPPTPPEQDPVRLYDFEEEVV